MVRGLLGPLRPSCLGRLFSSAAESSPIIFNKTYYSIHLKIIGNELITIIVVGCSLDEKEVFFKIRSAEELAGPDDKLVPLLEGSTADETAETG